MRFLTQTTPPAAASVTPAAPGTAIGQAQSIDQLQVGMNELQQQLQGLRAQRVVLRHQLATAPSEGLAHTQLEVKQATLDNQIVQTEMDYAGAKAELAARQGSQTPVATVIVPTPPIPFPFRKPFDPDIAAGLMFAFIFAVLMPISFAYARRIWRGKPSPAPRLFDDASAQRLERLEQGVDAIAIEIERIAEGQRFVTKVLAGQPIVQPARVNAEAPAASGDGQPTRALGAGPIEPIHAPERQRVKASITPH